MNRTFSENFRETRRMIVKLTAFAAVGVAVLVLILFGIGLAVALTS